MSISIQVALGILSKAFKDSGMEPPVSIRLKNNEQLDKFLDSVPTRLVDGTLSGNKFHLGEVFEGQKIEGQIEIECVDMVRKCPQCGCDWIEEIEKRPAVTQ